MLMHIAPDGWGGPWFLFVPLLWFAFFVAVAVLFRRRWGGWRRWNPAEDVLAERYARGEISAEEYHQRLGVLRRKES
jgi:putative membrane protein